MIDFLSGMPDDVYILAKQFNSKAPFMINSQVPSEDRAVSWPVIRCPCTLLLTVPSRRILCEPVVYQSIMPIMLDVHKPHTLHPQ